MKIPWKTILKMVTGIVVIPIAIISHKLWPWWSKQSLLVKVVSGIVVLPICGFAYATSKVWSDL